MPIKSALVAGLLVLAATGPAEACRALSSLAADFQNAYPTGGEVLRRDGKRGREIMQRLFVERPGHAIVFLYSGHGPVTGARGRYLYTVLDEQDCILHHDWIDGAVYDQVVGSE